jgi:hypothetical protein
MYPLQMLETKAMAIMRSDYDPAERTSDICKNGFDFIIMMKGMKTLVHEIVTANKESLRTTIRAAIKSTWVPEAVPIR